MRGDLDPPPGDGTDDPLDAALGNIDGIAEIERRFRALDARLGDVDAGRATAGPADGDVESVIDDDSPFADLEAVLREQRALRGDRARESDEVADDDAGDPGDPGDDDAWPDDDDDGAAHGAQEQEDPLALEIEQLCQDALDALDADERGLARDLAMTGVRLDDEHPFPMFVLGLIAEREDDLDTARDMAELALRSAGTNADAIGLRAHIHLRQHEFDQAEQLLRFGVAHNPDEATLHEGLARVALARGRHDEALQAAATALRIEPGNAGAMAVRAAALDDGADRGAMLAALRQGVQMHPEDPYSMVELASVEMEHGNVDRARVLLVRAQRLAPRDIEISDVRALIEHVDERTLLRRVPALLRWLRDFPGGLAGFLLGYVVAALPLHALASGSADYRIPALLVLVSWGAVALYAWIGPALLTHRLNQRAARGSFDRLAEELRDPCATLPSIARVGDVASMLMLARDRRGTAELVALAARRIRSQSERPLAPGFATASELADDLEGLARGLRSTRARLARLALSVPGDVRILVAIAVAAAIGAPAYGRVVSGVPVAAWYLVTAGCLVAAWWLHALDRRVVRRVDDAFVALGITAAGRG